MRASPGRGARKTPVTLTLRAGRRLGRSRVQTRLCSVGRQCRSVVRSVKGVGGESQFSHA